MVVLRVGGDRRPRPMGLLLPLKARQAVAELARVSPVVRRNIVVRLLETGPLGFERRSQADVLFFSRL